MSATGTKALWVGAPWALRIYVGLTVIGQLWSAIAYRTAYAGITALIVVALCWLMLRGVRWAWVVTVALTVVYLIVFLLAGRVFSGLSYLVPLALLLAPSTRWHFARERPSSAVSESRVSRLESSPLALRAFAAGLLVYAVGTLALATGDRLDDKPARVVIWILIAVAIYGSIGYFVVRGARVAWSLSIALLSVVVAATVAAGHWPVGVVPAGLLLLLLLPDSVAFVWRDRRRPAV